MNTLSMQILAAMLALPTVALADVTVHTQTTGKMVLDLTSEGVTQFKGKSQRTDSTFRGKSSTLIIDIDGRRFIDLDAKKKSAAITPLDVIAAEVQKAGAGAIDASIRKMAEAGMALESNLTIEAGGNGPMAAMMGKLAKGNITTTVTAIDATELPDANFEIPADYKTKTRD